MKKKRRKASRAYSAYHSDISGFFYENSPENTGVFKKQIKILPNLQGCSCLSLILINFESYIITSFRSNLRSWRGRELVVIVKLLLCIVPSLLYVPSDYSLSITLRGKSYYITLQMKMLETFSISHSFDKSQDMYADP